jgi:glycosyltransferase involved in cell wall biosynthesis
MKQKKIAFVISSNEIGNWSGGISYYRNFFNLLKNEKNLKLIVYTDSQKFIKLNKLGNFIKIKEVNFLKKWHLFYYLRKLIIFLFKKDLILFNSLIKENISTLSHRKLFKNSKIKIIGWIPDLQHKVLKKFFKGKNYFYREKYVQNEIKNSDKIFVSSYQVKKEFKKYYNVNKKIIPLRILSNVSNSKTKLKRYLLFPAQFWEHKNHRFLIKVAKIIKAKNLPIKIFFCGKIDNFKDKNYFLNINKKISDLKLNNIIQNFGEVSLYKLNKMQNECLALINPSYYEGWSTINEEARSKLKYIFLSNIKGHKEQNNYGAIYFDLNLPEDFIKKLEKFLIKKTYLRKNNFSSINKKFIKKINIESKNILNKEYV